MKEVFLLRVFSASFQLKVKAATMRVMQQEKERAIGLRAFILFALMVCAASTAALQAGSTESTRGAASVLPAARSAPGQQPRAEVPPQLPEWTDGNATVPPVIPGVPCSLPEVLRSAGERLKELVTDLPQFTATEQVEHWERDKTGKWRTPDSVTFSYLAELQEIRPGMLTMNETRNGSTSADLFPAKLADYGLPALVLVFHPYFADEYDMTCEGMSRWGGQPAWQVRFQQRPDRPARLRAYVAGNRAFAEKLRGRAWIAADSYQIVWLEAHLMEPIPEVRLMQEDLAIEYHPVRFAKHDVVLWLPKSAQVYLNVHGRFFRRTHTFNDYLLFAVDIERKTTGPR